MNLPEYLSRIGYKGSQEPSADTLQLLHLAHMLSVPFENLDIPLGAQISLSVPSFYEKTVQRRRGGFCYELNGLFGWLLENLGFRVTLLSARMFDDGTPGPEFDHLAVLVELEERWIADVGSGDSFQEPLRLDFEKEQEQAGKSYRLRGPDSEIVLEQRRRGNYWEPRYVFSLIPRRLEDFAAMCRYHQTSPESSFTQKAMCSLATRDRRITLSNGRLIVTAGSLREERELADEQEYLTAL